LQCARTAGGKMKSFKWKYEKLEPLDVCFSRDDGLLGWLIRSFIKSKVNHALLIDESRGQLFGVEMNSSGLDQVSLEKYNTSKNQIVEIYRFLNYGDPNLRNRRLDAIALARRRMKEKYAFGTFFMYGLRKLLPFLKPKDEKGKMVCSELDWRTLKDDGFNGYPESWDKFPPEPEELRSFISKRHDFIAITNFRG